jgi:transposase
MDRAYADKKTRMLAWEMRFNPVVPPKWNQKHQWKYDKKLCKRRDEAERLFRRLKSFRAIAARYDRPASCFPLSSGSLSSLSP